MLIQCIVYQLRRNKFQQVKQDKEEDEDLADQLVFPLHV